MIAFGKRRPARPHVAPTSQYSVDVLLDRIDKVRSAGADRWMACCPAHDDRSPSLSIRDTGDRVLLHCFAGCDADSILDAVGLQWADLYPDRWEAAKQAAFAHKRRLLPVDPMEHERLITRIAEQAILNGCDLSLEDEARLLLAVERLSE